MNREELLKTLNEIVAENFDDDSIVLTEESTAADVAEWDSLENINIVMACERQWNIKFDLNEIAEMKNVGKMIDVIASKLA